MRPGYLTGVDLMAGVARGRGVVECGDAGRMAALTDGRRRDTALAVTRRGGDTAGEWDTTGFDTCPD